MSREPVRPLPVVKPPGLRLPVLLGLQLALAYRSRATPESSTNLAWFSHAPLHAQSLGTLGSQPALLATCVLSEGFTIEGWE